MGAHRAAPSRASNAPPATGGEPPGTDTVMGTARRRAPVDGCACSSSRCSSPARWRPSSAWCCCSRTKACTPPPSQAQQSPVHGLVTSAVAADCTDAGGTSGGTDGCVALDVSMSDGPLPGRSTRQLVPAEPGTPRFAVGDEIVLSYSGGNPEDPGVLRRRGLPARPVAGVARRAVRRRGAGARPLEGAGLAGRARTDVRGAADVHRARRSWPAGIRSRSPSSAPA